MNLSDFDYHLPKEMIAQHPLAERDQSKLMVLNRRKRSIEHHRFFELPELLDPNSVLVFNESRVIPARLKFKWGNGNAEILLIKPIHSAQPCPLMGAGEVKGVCTWECMVRPGPKFQPRAEFEVDSELSFHVKSVTSNGLREIKFYCDDFNAYLKKHGHTPLPPYIKEDTEDPERYQTVYAKSEGSVAAPTAGFHFTERVFEDLRKKGVQTEFVTLHVGLGTFQPVKTDDITDHQMHSEWFSLPADVAERLNKAKENGKKIVAVGTTSVRVLESCAEAQAGANRDSRLRGGLSGETDIFIYPGYKWKFVDQMITNFHVPKSTLLMLVSSFASFSHTELDSGSKMEPQGRDFILQAYEEAKKTGYRFFSFGDSMLIL